MLDSFLRHVTKDSYGPISFREKAHYPVVLHKFHDAISVLGWGRMPDLIQERGKVGALVYSLLNERFKDETVWKNFLKSPEALTFRKTAASIQQSGSLSATLNELSEKFPLPSTFIGVVDENQFRKLENGTILTDESLLKMDWQGLDLTKLPAIYPVSEYIAEEKIPHGMIMGRSAWDYSVWRNQTAPKAFPFEFLCHFTLTENSLKRLKVDSVSLPKTASLQTLQAGTSWDFPVIELVLPQDPFERRIGLSEALWITGLSPDFLQRAMLSAAWTATFARHQMKRVKLNSIRVRFAIQQNGELMLNDCFFLDDLQIEKDGKVLHSESALEFYQKTSWYEAVVHARHHAETFGMAEWRRLCAEPAPFMDPKFKARLETDHQEIAKCLLE